MSFLLKKDDPNNEVGQKNKDSGSTLAKESQENLQMLINYVRVDSEKEIVHSNTHLDKLVNGMHANDNAKVSFFFYMVDKIVKESHDMFFFFI